METFQANQARLREEEEREREERERLSQRAMGGYGIRIGSPLRRKPVVGMETEVAMATPGPPTGEDDGGSSGFWSVTEWIGSWLGWK